jgi:hypothetical protein
VCIAAVLFTGVIVIIGGLLLLPIGLVSVFLDFLNLHNENKFL